MRYSFLGFWILGIICFVSLVSSVGVILEEQILQMKKKYHYQIPV